MNRNRSQYSSFEVQNGEALACQKGQKVLRILNASTRCTVVGEEISVARNGLPNRQ